MPYRAIMKEQYEVDFSPADTNAFTGRSVAQIPRIDTIWGHGNTTGLINAWWVTYQDNLASTANDDWDLRALTGAGNPEGATVTFAELRAIYLFTNTTLTLSPHPSTNPWTALGAAFSISVKANTYSRYLCDTDRSLPVTVSDKVLRINNPGLTAATYSLAILGTLN